MASPKKKEIHQSVDQIKQDTEQKPKIFYLIRLGLTPRIRWGISSCTPRRWNTIASSTDQEVVRVLEVFGKDTRQLEKAFERFTRHLPGYLGGSFFEMHSENGKDHNSNLPWILLGLVQTMAFYEYLNLDECRIYVIKHCLPERKEIVYTTYSSSLFFQSKPQEDAKPVIVSCKRPKTLFSSCCSVPRRVEEKSEPLVEHKDSESCSKRKASEFMASFTKKVKLKISA